MLIEDDVLSEVADLEPIEIHMIPTDQIKGLTDEQLNEEFTKALGNALNRPTALAMPAFAARLAFGEMADEMLLVSQRVVPKRLTSAGFKFQCPQLRNALDKYLS